LAQSSPSPRLISQMVTQTIIPHNNSPLTKANYMDYAGFVYVICLYMAGRGMSLEIP
jgi:hypothetical protein